jgi:hypothetical protein
VALRWRRSQGAAGRRRLACREVSTFVGRCTESTVGVEVSRVGKVQRIEDRSEFAQTCVNRSVNVVRYLFNRTTQ